jgi:hypothetical protein
MSIPSGPRSIRTLRCPGRKDEHNIANCFICRRSIVVGIEVEVPKGSVNEEAYAFGHGADHKAPSATEFFNYIESGECAGNVDGSEDDLRHIRVLGSHGVKIVVPKL